MLNKFNAWVEECSVGRSWVLRLPVWFFFLFLTFRYFNNPNYYSIFSGINLGIHELGHMLFSPLGLTFNIIGGTFIQCAVPVFSFWMFSHQQDVFALSFSFCWLGTNFFGVAEYIADARAMAIPLVSPFGGHVYHDWNYLLGLINGLAYDRLIANTVRLFGYVCMVASVIFGARVLWLMATLKNNLRHE